MEKFIFLAEIKDRLTELKLPQEVISKHLKIFEDCFVGKSAEEIDKIIDGTGGVEGIVKSIFNLETAKKNISPAEPQETATVEEDSSNTESNENVVLNNENDTPADSTVLEADAPSFDILADIPDAPQETDVTELPTSEFSAVTKDDSTNLIAQDSTEQQKVETTENSTEATDSVSENIKDTSPILDRDITEKTSTEESSDTAPELEKSPDIDKHIRDAEILSDTLERIPVQPKFDEYEEEFAEEFSDYDFEKLFAEKLSFPEKIAKKLREKLPKKAYYATMPIAILIDVIMFILTIALYPLLIGSAVIFGLVYLVTLVAGICFAVIPTGYGIYMCFKSMPIATYELSLGIISAGVTMFVCILLYNYNKRLVPFLFKQLKKLVKLWGRINKRYFGKTAKEEK